MDPSAFGLLRDVSSKPVAADVSGTAGTSFTANILSDSTLGRVIFVFYIP